MKKIDPYLKIPEYKEMLEKMTKEEIKECFSSTLSFGTSGIRGIMGIGTNRINIFTVVKVIAGASLYLKSKNKKNVLIAYDTRRNSKMFAETAYYVFRYFGINARLFKDFTPTPVLSFAVKKHCFDLGVNITSSHNTKDYNGIKIVDNIGSQIDEKTSNQISKYMEQVNEFNLYDLVKNKKIHYVSNNVYKEYLSFVLKNVNSYAKPKIKVLYTPLNGTNGCFMKSLLKKRKFDFNLVKKQQNQDENFTTCENPNPELYEAYNESLKVNQNEDLIIANDPDGDRLGVMCKTIDGYKLLTGNELGKIFTYFLIKNKKVNSKRFITTTVVTSRAIKKLCEEFNVEYFETLTGFKHISKKVEEMSKSMTPILFFEESCGYEVTGKLRDKDGISAGLLILEIANYYAYQNKTLFDVLDEIDKITLNMSEKSKSYFLEKSKMKDILSRVRKNENLNIEILSKTDFLETKKTLLPKSNFVKLVLKEGEVIIRPSGTEPKLKVYAFSEGKTKTSANNKLDKIFKKVEKII